MNEKARPVIMNRSSASGHFACPLEAPLIPRKGDIMRIHEPDRIFGNDKRFPFAHFSVSSAMSLR
jgi:hypothetical protein